MAQKRQTGVQSDVFKYKIGFQDFRNLQTFDLYDVRGLNVFGVQRHRLYMFIRETSIDEIEKDYYRVYLIWM